MLSSQDKHFYFLFIKIGRFSSFRKKLGKHPEGPCTHVTIPVLDDGSVHRDYMHLETTTTTVEVEAPPPPEKPAAKVKHL